MSQGPFEPTHGCQYNRPLAAASGSNDQIVTAAKIKVAIASAVRLVRESLTLSLRDRDGIVVVDAVGLDPEGIARIAAATPDVVLVDLSHTEPAATTNLLKVSCSKAKLVAFALAEIDDDVFACAAAGFSGYVPCEGGADELYRALIDAAGGRMHCAPHIAAAMFSRLSVLVQQRPALAVLPSLTARENEIMILAEEGRSNKEIARRLQISAATVKNHIHNILQKLQVGRRGEAVARLRTTRLV
jgi:two-component system nitrate/nitrite response regulator NarL